MLIIVRRHSDAITYDSICAYDTFDNSTIVQNNRVKFVACVLVVVILKLIKKAIPMNCYQRLCAFIEVKLCCDAFSEFLPFKILNILCSKLIARVTHEYRLMLVELWDIHGMTYNIVAKVVNWYPGKNYYQIFIFHISRRNSIY